MLTYSSLARTTYTMGRATHSVIGRAVNASLGERRSLLRRILAFLNQESHGRESHGPRRADSYHALLRLDAIAATGCSPHDYGWRCNNDLQISWQGSSSVPAGAHDETGEDPLVPDRDDEPGLPVRNTPRRAYLVARAA